MGLGGRGRGLRPLTLMRKPPAIVMSLLAVCVAARVSASDGTLLLSMNAAGTASGAFGASAVSSISADGRFVTLVGGAADLVNDDTNSGLNDVFLRDLRRGVTTLVSRNHAGTGSGSYISFGGAISERGNMAAFTSYASDLTALDPGINANVYARHLRHEQTELASINADGTSGGNGNSFVYDPETAISAGGHIVVFQSAATDLVSLGTPDQNGAAVDVFARDVQNGTTRLVSVNLAGTSTGNATSRAPQVSPNGRLVAFQSDAEDLVLADGNGATDLFVRDLRAGTTRLVSVNQSGTGGGNGVSYLGRLGVRGRFLSFNSVATDLVSVPAGGSYTDSYVRDLRKGVTTLVSSNRNGTGGGDYHSYPAVLDATGRLAAFESYAFDLTTDGGGPGFLNIYVRDLTAGTTQLVSVSRTGTRGNGHSVSPRITPDGRFVVFVSAASDLVSQDTNGTSDLFVRDLQAGTTRLLSTNVAGTDSGNGETRSFVLSVNGRVIGFTSLAENLVPFDANGFQDAFAFRLR